MEKNEILDILKSILIENLYIEISKDKIDTSTNLQSTYQVDSLGFVELRFQSEERFNVKINDEDFISENFNSLNNIADTVIRLQHD